MLSSLRYICKSPVLSVSPYLWLKCARTSFANEIIIFNVLSQCFSLILFYQTLDLNRIILITAIWMSRNVWIMTNTISIVLAHYAGFIFSAGNVCKFFSNICSGIRSLGYSTAWYYAKKYVYTLYYIKKFISSWILSTVSFATRFKMWAAQYFILFFVHHCKTDHVASSIVLDISLWKTFFFYLS